MNRKNTAYKLMLAFFLVAVVTTLPISVWAQETTLTLNVPFTHTLHIELIGNGRVIVDGVPYEKTVDIQIKRHSTPDISVEAENGWKVKSVFLDGQDITEQIQSDTFTFSEMCDDLKLIVVFETQSSTPQTGDKSNIEFLYLVMFLSVIGMLLCVIEHRKTRTNAK